MRTEKSYSKYTCNDYRFFYVVVVIKVFFFTTMLYGEEKLQKNFSEHINIIARYSALIKYVDNIPTEIYFSEDDLPVLHKNEFSSELCVAIGKLTTLKKIYISAKNLTDQDVINMLNEELEELYIGSACISDVTMFELIKVTPKLKTLSVSHSHISIVGLFYVAQIPTINTIAISSVELSVARYAKTSDYVMKFFPNIDIRITPFALGKTCFLCCDCPVTPISPLRKEENDIKSDH